MTSLDIHAALVVSMDGSASHGVGCVRVDDGRISSISRAPTNCGCGSDARQKIDASGMAALPGFIDGHRHTWQTSLRHAFAGSSFSEYGRTVLGSIGQHLTPDDLHVATLLGALSAIDSGVTTMVDWAHALNSPEHADAGVEALTASGIRAQFGYGIPRDGTRDWMTDASTRGHPRDLERIHRALAGNPLVSAVMASRGPEMSSPETTRDDVEFARSLGVRMSMHVGGGDLGPRYRAILRLDEWGLLGDDYTFIHLSSTSDDELRLIRECGAGTCIGPAAETLMAGIGWPVTRRLLAHGLEPALSGDTEAASSAAPFDQLRAVLTAGAVETDASQEPTLDASTALRLVTSAGARAIGVGDIAGRLVEGAAADIVLIDLDAPNLAPATDPVNTIVLGAHAGNVDTVVIGGIVRKRAGKLVVDGYAQLVDRARASAARLLRAA